MIKIGITGNIACGKSTAFEIIKLAGYPIIDCDDIVKTLYSNSNFIAKLSKNFPQIINNNKIDLKKLRDFLFSDKYFKNNFEVFVFPKVKEKIMKFFEENAEKDKVFVVAPLLFEAGFESLFDKIIFISSDENIRLKRLIKRNSMLSTIADKVIKMQICEDEKIKKSDYIIRNNGTINEFIETINALIY